MFVRSCAFLFLLTSCASLGVARHAESAERNAKAIEVPSFYVREVTSYRPNLAVCLVCRYGARPVVLVCMRDIDKQAESLIEHLDRTVDAHRGVGLRGFGIFVGDDTRDAQPKMATLARQRKLSLPLAFPVESGGPKVLELSKEKPVEVLIYRDKKVQERFAFDEGELTKKQIAAVVEAVESYVED